jgi:hypothetical protein
MKFRNILRNSLALAGAATAAYAGYAGITWLRYGKAGRRTGTPEDDALLHRFMPIYEVAERQHVRIAAPAEVALAVAREADLRQSPVVRAIFRGRELLMGSGKSAQRKPQGMVDELMALGWSLLAEVPGREIVLGTATQPWLADVEFHRLSPEEFFAFHEPDYVKIAFTLRADPAGDAVCVFRTETRVISTDAAARARFRRYWAFLSPGILLIRRTLLRVLKKAAEARAAQPGGLTAPLRVGR